MLLNFDLFKYEADSYSQSSRRCKNIHLQSIEISETIVKQPLTNPCQLFYMYESSTMYYSYSFSDEIKLGLSFFSVRK